MSFFQPLQRKLGAVTLMMACVFMGGWLRSQYVFDIASVPVSSTTTLVLVSGAGAIDFGQCWEPDSKGALTFFAENLRSQGATYLDDSGYLYPWEDDHQFFWRWDWAGFRGGVSRINGRLDLDCMVPYWSIVIPLTILSAWLLLSKTWFREAVVSHRTQPR